MADKTIIRCRPGMKQAMEAAFVGMEVIVDDNLDVDYKFDKRELNALEEIEAQIEEEEKQEADPKNAITFVVPLAVDDDDKADPFGVWLAVRIEQNFSRTDAEREISTVKITKTGDEINAVATAASVRQALKKAGANVLSVSVAQGIVFPDL